MNRFVAGLILAIGALADSRVIWTDKHDHGAGHDQGCGDKKVEDITFEANSMDIAASKTVDSVWITTRETVDDESN